MSSVFRVFFIASVLFVLSGHSFAQADEICGESAGSTWMTTPFVYGRVLLNGFKGAQAAKSNRHPLRPVTVRKPADHR